ncbi:hypothetical protein GFD17_00200 [Bifidobacterium sp. SMB2]|uniref:CDF family cation diffusion facilitator n=1 Tax=Bifidobacterium saimiriisciurei TaxID=2661627 RepID=A0ABX0C9B2_9BIFI|nr:MULTISPECIES: hypothetical protein [Bifidobacterium]NEG95204.1 hypothetical protein [Bifidobacterium sp. SMB2]NEH11281.1 hypothetical protein [Bifidobacterium saimiriisciurei]
MAKRLVAFATAVVMLAAMAAVDAVRGVPAAQAAGAQVSATVEGGSLNPNGKTTVDLSGSGFQSVQGGFGGIYVLFGWVSDPNGDSWKPSKGGVTGEDYRYVPDDENNPAGYDVFVAFPGDSTASAANGGQIAANGTWNAKITVPGAKFTSYDRSNNPTEVDCTAVQCGIITIGAHGVVNSSNETFTPLSFAAQSSEQSSSDSGSDSSDDTASTDSSDDAAAAKAAEEAKKKQAAAQAAAKKKAEEEAARKAAEAAAASQTTEGNDMNAQIPVLGVAGWLIVAAIIIFGIAIIVLAAGVGGYLAMKSVLLGVSPAALDKEIAKRERHAEDVRAREAMKSARRRRRQYQRLLKEQGRADQVQSLVEDAPLPAPFGTSAATQAMPPVPAGDGAAAVDGVGIDGAASTGRAVPNAGDAASGGASVAAGVRGFFARRAANTGSDVTADSAGKEDER